MDAQETSFRTTIGVDVKGEVWNCVEIPASTSLFGTGKSVRIDAKIDDVLLANVGTLPTGEGGHMVSLNAKVRKELRKGIGDVVDVTITRR
ncbi:uncharacterized protein DUF1905 [Microbacterium sp. SLBN-154]|uniref:DUF1905 domain-containing protein n=1 Tax=Microbacterium sp. SLBN-154 TaxID=2768458 RepID=UPI00114F4C6F|nr:DUF1905 domain-containing protein [Microbacterium sp. SLBN-154]TQK17930.1 uncharacterized protein DUF1905 [Microbacterium sp. SLBN-154]